MRAGGAGSEPVGFDVLGGFFALGTHDPRVPTVAPWRPMGELLDTPGVLAGRVASGRTALAAMGGHPADRVEDRVAASVVHLGLVARLLSPAFAAAVLDVPTAPMDPRTLRWRPEPGSTFPLSAPPYVPERDPGADGALAWLLDGPVAELTDLIRGYHVSGRTLWGNVASAANGAAATLAAALPRYAPRARAVRDALLCHPRLRGTAADAADRAFRRRSCCLIYRAAPDRAGSLCGDCVLLAAPAARRRG